MREFRARLRFNLAQPAIKIIGQSPGMWHPKWVNGNNACTGQRKHW